MVSLTFSKVAVVRWTKSKVSELNILSRKFYFPDYIQLPTSCTGPLFCCLWNWWPKGCKRDFFLLWQLGDLELQEGRKYDKNIWQRTVEKEERWEAEEGLRSIHREGIESASGSQRDVSASSPILNVHVWLSFLGGHAPGKWIQDGAIPALQVCVCVRLGVRGQPWCNCHQGHSKWGHGGWGYMQQAPPGRAALGAVLFLWFPYFWHPPMPSLQ